jgi:glycosyltransferase involved in cell wall biosynthesis
MDYPRLLVISPGVLNPYKSSGVTLRRLLAGWPPERLAQIHHDLSPPDDTVCRHYYSTAAPFLRLGVRPAVRRAGQLAAFALGRAEHGLVWARLSPRLRDWLDDFGPEVILSETGHRSFLQLTTRIAHYTGAPVVLHQPDDWVADWPGDILGFALPGTQWLASRTRREFAALAGRATVTTAISEAMREEYRERYGGEWAVFPNVVDAEEWPAPARSPGERRGEEFRILYSGALLAYGQLPGVLDVARAVSSLARSGLPIRFDVATHAVTAPATRHLTTMPGVRVIEMVPPEQLPGRLQSYDLLVIPQAFEERRARYIRLSMPGKAAEYAASGTPVLVYGRPESALVRHARQYGWAEAVSEPSPEALSAAVRALMADPHRCDELAARSREVALEQFDARRLRGEFQRLLCRAAEAPVRP